MNDLTGSINTLITDHLYTLFPAASVCIIHRGEMILRQSWGHIDPDTRTIPVTNATLFDLASITKLFVVSAFLSLVSEGKADLDAPIATVLPEFAAQNPRGLDGGVDPFSKAPLPFEASDQKVDAQQVTFRQLLTHTSGLAAWRDIYNAAGTAPTITMDMGTRQQRWQQGLQAIFTAPFVSQPGAVVRYSDLGLMLLGEAVARLHQKPMDEAGSKNGLENAVHDRVTAPLALSTVTYLPLEHGYTSDQIAPTEDDPAWRGRRCWGEVHDENACGVGGIAGHAGLFGTAQDIARVGEAWRGRDPRLNIDPALMEQATREQAVTGNERRGLGWMIRSHQGSSAGDTLDPSTYGHTGFTGNSLYIDPTRSLVIALLTNYVYYGRENGDIYAFRRAFHNLIGAMIQP